MKIVKCSISVLCLVAILTGGFSQEASARSSKRTRNHSSQSNSGAPGSSSKISGGSDSPGGNGPMLPPTAAPSAPVAPIAPNQPIAPGMKDQCFQDYNAAVNNLTSQYAIDHQRLMSDFNTALANCPTSPADEKLPNGNQCQQGAIQSLQDGEKQLFDHQQILMKGAEDAFHLCIGFVPGSEH